MSIVEGYLNGFDLFLQTVLTHIVFIWVNCRLWVLFALVWIGEYVLIQMWHLFFSRKKETVCVVCLWWMTLLLQLMC